MFCKCTTLPVSASLTYKAIYTVSRYIRWMRTKLHVNRAIQKPCKVSPFECIRSVPKGLLQRTKHNSEHADQWTVSNCDAVSQIEGEIVHEDSFYVLIKSKANIVMV